MIREAHKGVWIKLQEKEGYVSFTHLQYMLSREYGIATRQVPSVEPSDSPTDNSKVRRDGLYYGPSWFIKAMNGDPSVADKLLPGFLQNYSREERYIMVVADLMGTPLPMTDVQCRCFQLYLELRNLEESRKSSPPEG